ncbi:MAG: response regulator [Lachnospiraceae bacterium]|nr:response regulator [Lachnospiraceae bacterium]
MKKILLVDDDQDMMMLTGRWLKKEYEVATAGSGQEALDYLKSDKPDLVLLDFMMPEMDGPATLKAIRENADTSELPVYFLTGAEDAESMEKVKELNPQGFLPKSLGKKGLMAALEEHFV